MPKQEEETVQNLFEVKIQPGVWFIGVPLFCFLFREKYALAYHCVFNLTCLPTNQESNFLNEMKLLLQTNLNLLSWLLFFTSSHRRVRIFFLESSVRSLQLSEYWVKFVILYSISSQLPQVILLLTCFFP